MSSPSSPRESSARLRGLVWLAIAATVAFLFAFGFGPLVRMVPWSVEERIAERLGPIAISSGCEREDGDAALQKLVAKLHPHGPEDESYSITVEVIQGDAVNAFASLGGRIFVFDGLLREAESPDEVAGVLAHEIGHVAGRHVLQKIALQLFTLPFTASSDGGRVFRMLANLKYGRQQEHDADLDGLARLQQAKIDTTAVARFFERLSESSSMPEILSDHPASDRRAELAKSRAGGPTEPALSPDEWKALQKICRPLDAAERKGVDPTPPIPENN